MQIAANKAVSIDYTLTNDAGEVIDSSAGGAPLVYLHGCRNIIVGLEKALEGKQAGDELSVTIEPEEAYGEYSVELVATLNRSMFEGVDQLEVGMQFHASGPDGGMQIVTIRELDGDDVDALVQVGTNLAAIRLCAAAEQFFAKPVLAINATTYWDALRRSGIQDRVHGYGTLLEKF